MAPCLPVHSLWDEDNADWEWEGTSSSTQSLFACHCAGMLAITLLFKLDLEGGCGCEETGIETKHILGGPVPPFALI